jgi:hypothetical protein
MNWKGWGRKKSWLNLRYFSSISPKRLRKATKNVSQNINPWPRFELGTFRLQSRCANYLASTFTGEYFSHLKKAGRKFKLTEKRRRGGYFDLRGRVD